MMYNFESLFVRSECRTNKIRQTKVTLEDSSIQTEDSFSYEFKFIQTSTKLISRHMKFSSGKLSLKISTTKNIFRKTENRKF